MGAIPVEESLELVENPSPTSTRALIQDQDCAYITHNLGIGDHFLGFLATLGHRCMIPRFVSDLSVLFSVLP